MFSHHPSPIPFTFNQLTDTQKGSMYSLSSAARKALTLKKAPVKKGKLKGNLQSSANFIILSKLASQHLHKKHKFKINR